jgi:hypothetical protein
MANQPTLRRRVLLVIALLLTRSATAYAATPDAHADFARHQQFRDAVIAYVHDDAYAYLTSQPPPRMPNKAYDHHGRWRIEVRVYLDGILRGVGQSRADLLSDALHAATMTALSSPTSLVPGELSRARFLVSFDYPPRRIASIVDDRGAGRELLGDVVAIRQLDRSVVERQLERAKHYLLGIMDAQLHGFPKTYDASTDVPEDRLRTIYTASSLLTLLKLDAWKPDPAIEAQVQPIADYLLSMQCQEGPCRGAFYHSYFPAEKRREERFVVGTASKTIFTLLQLWRRGQDPRYLRAAEQAGEWLTTMVNSNGSVNAALEWKDGKWQTETQFSLLYSGQVLSALSRLYAVDQNERYRKAADRIAALFRGKVAGAGGGVLGDAFREPNSVSTSWVAQAMYDHSRIDTTRSDHEIVFRAMDAVLANQVDAPFDPYYDGSIFDDPSSSGTGWVNEVLVDVNHLCQEDGRGDCERYRQAMVRASRWLIQRSYSEPNTFALRNPARALGGAIRHYDETIVRTDAVCHGSNSLLGLLELAGDDIHLTLEPPRFDQFFRALRLSVEHD